MQSRTLLSIVFLSVFLSVPARAQETPKVKIETITHREFLAADPDGPIAIPIEPPFIRDEDLSAWYRSQDGQQFDMLLPGYELFRYRISLRAWKDRYAVKRRPSEPDAPGKMTHTFPLDPLFSFEARVYGPVDRALASEQLHHFPASPSEKIRDHAAWTASFRYVPRTPENPPSPEIVSTYTFTLNALKSDHVGIIRAGGAAPVYVTVLRAAGLPACPMGQKEEPFSDAPPFRLGICVHESGGVRDVGATQYSIVAHFDESLRWKDVSRREGLTHEKLPPSPENPVIPIEVYDVVFTDADGKEVPHVLDFRALYHWTERRTLFLSQHGIRELRWVGDLDGPIVPLAAVTP